VKPTVIERRQLLQGGLGAFLSLINNASVADVLLPDIATIIDGDGLLGAQLRLGELLIRYLAGGKDGAAKQNTGNVVVSPASLAAVLSFVDLGGSNKMHAAIHRALGFKTTAQRTKDLAGLRTSVSGLIRQGSKDGPLVLANLIVFDRVVKPKQLALLGLSRASADMLVDNLADARVIDRINGWVKQKTYELIPEIIGEALETLGLLGLNALYFKDKWQTPFEPSRTKGEQFQTFSGKPADVQMMHSKLAKFRFRQDDRFIAAELGYASENFRLVVITTKSTPAGRRNLPPRPAGSTARVLRRRTARSPCRSYRFHRPAKCFSRSMRSASRPRAAAPMRWRDFPTSRCRLRGSSRSSNCASMKKAPRARRQPQC